MAPLSQFQGGYRSQFGPLGSSLTGNGGPTSVAIVDAAMTMRREAAGQATMLGLVFAVGGALALTSFQLPVICPLRLATKVPCPLCGMTTGTTALMRGRFAEALEANPLSLFFVPAAAVLFAERLVRALRPSGIAINIRVRQSLIWLGVGIVMAASWLYQLIRFGFIS